MSKKTFGLLLVVAALISVLLVPVASADSGPRTYLVTVTNDTDGQPMTPPLASTHRSRAHIYKVGTDASYGVMQIAENGNLDPAYAERTSNARVFDTVIGFPDPDAPGPLLPGGTTTFEISSKRGVNWFSFVSMLVCTNDGFTGVNVRLPKTVGDTVGADLRAYDAGTEANTENFSDLVPPCGGIPMVGTGMSNANLAQMGVIHAHAGVTGSGSEGLYGNLDPAVHGWTDIGTITIERTN